MSSFDRRALLQGSAAALALQALPAEARTPDEAADRLLERITEQLLSDYPESATSAGVDKDDRARLRSKLIEPLGFGARRHSRTRALDAVAIAPSSRRMGSALRSSSTSMW